MTTPASNSNLAILAPKIEALDAFAEANNISSLTEGKGQFSSAIAVADAINQLKMMLTPEIMQPIMALQGTPLGYKTDKDSSGGYSVDVVREAFIEVTLKGFKIVGNEMNIIAGRGYITKEGFEGALLRLGRAGKFTDYRDSYSIPKAVSDNEAIVSASASWKWNGVAGSLENVQFSIRVNKGMGADGIIGKAKRKLKARIFERVTGTIITDGDVSEATVVDVEARNVVDGQKTATSTGAGQEAANGATEDQKTLLKELMIEHDAEAQANAWLKEKNAIPANGTYLDVSGKLAARILSKPKDFIASVTESKTTAPVSQ
jgi:hypothetical protein